MRDMTRIILFLISILLLGGCSDEKGTSSKMGKENNVENIINEQIRKTEEEEQAEGNPDSYIDDTIPEHAIDIDTEELDSLINENASTDVDYDLTNMNRDMVYAVVYNMMMSPDSYIGKTFRMEGLYYAGYYEPTELYYHYCVIEDALACCAQGIEFVWGDGSRLYPDEYPQDNTTILVEGTFETYRDEGEPYLYSHLADSTLKIVSE